MSKYLTYKTNLLQELQVFLHFFGSLEFILRSWCLVVLRIKGWVNSKTRHTTNKASTTYAEAVQMGVC